jgi:hypothetical protein
MAKAAPAPISTSTVVNIDPTLILSDDNIRYGLKQSRLDSLKADIVNHGSIHTPGEVEPLVPPVNGKTYRLTVGAYRLRAALELNEQEKAGLTFPAFVRASGTTLDRLKRQLSENLERESMSPLDTAVAIKKLLDAGVSKSDVRVIFARPGGKKGTEMMPASNAFVNMTLSFLDLPKPIQEKIHLGLVGVGAAYELTKVSPERREKVLADAEAARLKDEEKRQHEDDKLLADEKRAADAKAKVDAEVMLLNVTKDELRIAEETLKAKAEESAKAFTVVQLLPKNASEEEKKRATEHMTALETDVKGARKLVGEKQTAVAKLENKVKGVTKVATSLKERLENARKAKAGKAGKGKTGGPGAREVKQAAAAAGEGNLVKLDAAGMRDLITTMSKTSHSTTKKIGKWLLDAIDGGPTPKETIDAIAIIVGDKPAPKVNAAKTK